ncbi:threonine--tRNA ligase [Candidatus Borkfalkia ceftriaxoniphila]|uniref:Threonine--tRNA ligase n=1 Tax=Candidatus Borkfalkia ceftriaxoniphila TaxID=2508949 RepID=A0A4Q2K4C3_9FIRM|nr:threonine--tRNA ligase [Candidatus Borkfalkia ceftriaxoniphila]RXZ57858.1 threonine--tRNA ligase [Candidatus Borkfalkia ceftriaxoniphila]
MEITLKNGDKKHFDKAASCKDIALSISEGLARAAVCAKVDGTLVDLSAVVDRDCEFEIVTLKDKEGLEVYRHTASHVLAQAVKAIFPTCKLAIGPTIENGFYYDIDFTTPISQEDLGKIEEEMKKIIKSNFALERFTLPRAEAIKLMTKYSEKYKVELIKDLPEDAEISFYKQGSFTDLCRGPHLPSTGKIKAFKLTSIAGAYWRGNEKNKMLTRIYGTAFAKKDEMDAYFTMLEEAKKRDHTKLGKELGLFALLNEGKGFPFFLPKGMVLKNLLIDYWRQLHLREGYVEVSTPVILNRSLWETSGHWDHYKDNMYTTKIDGEDCAIKPMNCPGGMLVYKLTPHSYKDLPIRMGELGLVHRHEKSGQLHGLMRVRCFTQDDAHIFMLPSQIKDEIKGVVKLINEVYTLFGFKYHVELSTRPADSMGTEEDWNKATEALSDALKDMNLPFVVNEGDGAFYGPKIDFHLEDSIGRTWQCGTIQLDFQMPQRFELEYTGEDGQKYRPIMIHRVVFGSIERFIGILIEHFAGKFPVWLAPVQVKILPVSDKSLGYARQLESEMRAQGIRVETDSRNEKIGYKIREAQLEKLPYMLIVGDKEREEGTVSVRKRDEGDIGALTKKDFIARVLQENADKTIF